LRNSSRKAKRRISLDSKTPAKPRTKAHRPFSPHFGPIRLCAVHGPPMLTDEAGLRIYFPGEFCAPGHSLHKTSTTTHHHRDTRRSVGISRNP
jgi:hypothetical protein